MAAVNPTFAVLKEKYFGDIRFWIMLFFVLRLIGITDPPLEIAHNWRQVTGNMVARNFFEIDSNILYPRLDIAGEKTGITGTEFSVLNYLMYLLSLLIGFHDWFGRLINLIISSIGVLYFYKLLKLKFDERFSFYAAFLLLSSMWLMFSRKVMPDTFSVSLVIIGLYHVFRYFGNARLFHAFLYFLFITAGVLSKIPAAYLLIVIAFPLLDPAIGWKQKVWVLLFSFCMLIPVAWWYFYWVPYLVQHYGFSHYYMGTSFSQGLSELLNNLSPTLEKFYFDAMKFTGFAASLFGLYFALKNKERRLLWIMFLCSLVFMVFMLKAGRNFYHHSYYIVPFVPVMCLLGAYAIVQIKKPWLQILAVFFITIESIANQQHDFRIKDSEKYKLSLETIADKFTSNSDLVAINGGDNPQQMYFLHRKGWTITTEQANDAAYVKELRDKGCRFIFINKHLLQGNEQGLHYPIVYSDENFIVYSL
ncbi:MAG TPA: glycosyltransferase family 39 protein [Bacteroidia bacterium]|jgi:hypothetical protein